MVQGVPATVPLVTCPRCVTLRRFDNVDGGITYRCSGCDWFFTLSALAVPAAPAVPATGVNATNTSLGVIAVTISANGATITAVNVNGVQVGTTAGTYLVPPLGTISIAYTVATPTWTWQLPVTNALVSAGGLALPVAAQGTVFTQGMQLFVDAGANADILVVGSGSTGTSIVTSALSKGHASGVSFGTLAATPTNNVTGTDAVPNVSPWPALQPNTF